MSRATQHPDGLHRTAVATAAAAALALLQARRNRSTAPTVPPTGQAAGGSRLSPRPDYRRQVTALTELVRSHIPAGSEVLVISRGDPALVELDPCRGRHFPADPTGTWAGHHPALGTAADLLQAQRGTADHLAIPATARWWFDTYPELVGFLAGGRCLAEDADAGWVWELPPRTTDTPAAVRPGGSDLLTYRSAAWHARSLVDALAGDGALVAVVSRGDPDLVAFDRCRGRHFPADDDGVYAGHPVDDDDAVGRLAEATAAGVRWLLVPPHADWWARVYPGFWRHLHDDHRLVLHRAGVGHLFATVPAVEAP